MGNRQLGLVNLVESNCMGSVSFPIDVTSISIISLLFSLFGVDGQEKE